MVTDPRYSKLTDEGKSKVLDKVKEKTKQDIFDKYRFTYQQDVKAKVDKSKESKEIII